MISRPLLYVAACVALVSLVACDNGGPAEPANATAAFAGKWEGTKRLVSCEPAGQLCQFQRLGEVTYFSAMLNQEGDVVDGSVSMSEGGPLALPYGFFIKGQVSSPAQLTFERVFFQDVGEPPYSGEIGIKTLLAPRLSGRMTKRPSAGDTLTLVWEVEAVRR